MRLCSYVMVWSNLSTDMMQFAKYLNEHGIYVVGHDHLGHGKSVQNEEYHGYFHKTNGNEYVIGDIHKLREMTQKKYPDKPYFMLGHSMGSFLIRQYMEMYGSGLSGVIVMGTGAQRESRYFLENYCAKSSLHLKVMITGVHLWITWHLVDIINGLSLPEQIRTG